MYEVLPQKRTERSAPENPFEPLANFFSIPRSFCPSLLPSFLPLLATLFLILFGMPHALCSVLLLQGAMARPPMP